jgi:putative ABC transport system permease protein
MRASSELRQSRFPPGDLLRTALLGLRARLGRSILTSVGIAVGVAAIVGVLGISASSSAELLRVLDTLGTNLMRVSAGQSFGGGDTELPEESATMVERIGPVLDVAQVTDVGVAALRNDLVPEEETNGIGVLAVSPDFLDTIGVSPEIGVGIDATTERLPVGVLGAVAAERLGLDADLIGTAGTPRLYVGGEWLTVVGILPETELHPDVDRSVLVGYPIAEDLYDTETVPTTLFVRAEPEDVEDVNGILGNTANPEAPNEIEVSRPSDALVAQQAAEETLTSLLIGLGGVALFVGALAIANVMVMSVLERRMEIGVRRALGATRGHIRLQFLTESMMLAALGGLAGIVLGAVATAAYATTKGWTVSLPVLSLLACVLVVLVIGAIAGFYPAMRAARVQPSEAVRTE